MVDIRILKQIWLTSSSKAKVGLLKGQPDSAKEFFRLALDPTVKFGIRANEDEAVDCWGSIEHNTPDDPDIYSALEERWWGLFLETLNQLKDRKLTGGRATDELVCLFTYAPSPEHAIWGARFVNKDLRCGINVASVNKVWPKLIDDLSVQLAWPYDPDKHEITGQWLMEPKLDGYRMTIIDGVAYTRNKRVFTTVDHIIKAIPQELLEQFVFDGEIMGESTDFDEAGGSLRRKGETAHKSVYHVFDVIQRSEWQQKTRTFIHRRRELVFMIDELDSPNIIYTPARALVNPTGEELFTGMKEMIGLGYEGAMIKDLDAPYVYDRTDRVLKLKDFVEGDYKIVDFKEGRGRHKGRLGAFYVDVDGVRTKVGSGFSDEQRADFWKRRPDLLDKTVEVKYQNKSKSGALRFPVFMRLRPDKD